MQKTFIASILVLVNISYAQDFQGVATYKSHRKMKIKIDKADENSKMHKELYEQLAKQFQNEYTLNFSREESTYKRNESLEKPMPSTSGITIKVSESSDVLYKNLKEKRYTNATELYGKLFLIKDRLKGPQWEFLKETKNIGEYTCSKAIFKETYKTQTITNEGAMETVEKERETTAWYTMEIPINNGPADYGGLPGLILEINDGELTLICSKIVMNPKESIKIVEPKKGKVVTQDEFEAISNKKTEEMMERFQARK